MVLATFSPQYGHYLTDVIRLMDLPVDIAGQVNIIELVTHVAALQLAVALYSIAEVPILVESDCESIIPLSGSTILQLTINPLSPSNERNGKEHQMRLSFPHPAPSATSCTQSNSLRICSVQLLGISEYFDYEIICMLCYVLYVSFN